MCFVDRDCCYASHIVNPLQGGTPYDGGFGRLQPTEDLTAELRKL